MSVTLYGLKNCDTCKKAMKALEANGQDFDFVDIRAEADLPHLVPIFMEKVGAEALVNKRSTTWRQLPDDQKQRADSAEAASLLIENPTLIKRPVIDLNGSVFVGWTKNTEQSVLGE